MEIIKVENVSKCFKSYKREKGFFKSVKSIFIRKYENYEAVKNISFTVNKGEAVAYLGANGAGKSTTIKMLSGILTPTNGSITVKGIKPYENRKENAYSIGVVFGQRTQLHWDLPIKDSYDLHRVMYKLGKEKFDENLNYYLDLMEMRSFYEKPVRQLSLGQKMRAELVASLLHEPEILYLDEPTIGLDVKAKNNMRELIKKINKEKQTTIILTTHDMMDIEEICEKIIILKNGEIQFDGSKQAFIEAYGGSDLLEIEFVNRNAATIHECFTIVKETGNSVTLEYDKVNVSVKTAIERIMTGNEIVDINTKKIALEDILARNF